VNAFHDTTIRALFQEGGSARIAASKGGIEMAQFAFRANG